MGTNNRVTWGMTSGGKTTWPLVNRAIKLDTIDGQSILHELKGYDPDAEVPNKSYQKIPLEHSPEEHLAEKWEAHRGLITRYYILEDKPLPEVKAIMALQHGFSATERQYKTRFILWKLTKNIKEKDMRVMLRKSLKRELEDGKKSEFYVDNRPVPPQKMARFAKRKDLTQEEILEEQMPTPSYITCNTPGASEGDDNLFGIFDEDLRPASETGLFTEVDSQQSLGRSISEAASQIKTPHLENTPNESVPTTSFKPHSYAAPRPSFIHAASLASSKSSGAYKSYHLRISGDSPFERCSPRYHLSDSPDYYQRDISSSNPLSLLPPLPIRSSSIPSSEPRTNTATKKINGYSEKFTDGVDTEGLSDTELDLLLDWKPLHKR